jgi:hypothetical protein
VVINDSPPACAIYESKPRSPVNTAATRGEAPRRIMDLHAHSAQQLPFLEFFAVAK